jgi:hypothetical protein
MNVGQLEDFLAIHGNELRADTELVVEVWAVGGAATKIAAVRDLEITGDRLMLRAMSSLD